MKKTKSVRFSSIEHEACEETSYVGSDISLVPEGITSEEVYVGNLFEHTKVYRCPTDGDDARRVSRKRKIAQLTVGFLLLLGVGGLAIYLISKELYNQGHQTYGRQLDPDKVVLAAEFPTKLNTTVAVNTSLAVSEKTIQSFTGAKQGSIRSTPLLSKQRKVYSTFTYEASLDTDLRSRQANEASTMDSRITPADVSSKTALPSISSKRFTSLYEITKAGYWSKITTFHLNKLMASPSTILPKTNAFSMEFSSTSQISRFVTGSSWSFGERSKTHAFLSRLLPKINASSHIVSSAPQLTRFVTVYSRSSGDGSKTNASRSTILPKINMSSMELSSALQLSQFLTVSWSTGHSSLSISLSDKGRPTTTAHFNVSRLRSKALHLTEVAENVPERSSYVDSKYSRPPYKNETNDPLSASDYFHDSAVKTSPAQIAQTTFTFLELSNHRFYLKSLIELHTEGINRSEVIRAATRSTPIVRSVYKSYPEGGFPSKSAFSHFTNSTTTTIKRVKQVKSLQPNSCISLVTTSSEKSLLSFLRRQTTGKQQDLCSQYLTSAASKEMPLSQMAPSKAMVSGSSFVTSIKDATRSQTVPNTLRDQLSSVNLPIASWITTSQTNTNTLSEDVSAYTLTDSPAITTVQKPSNTGEVLRTIYPTPISGDFTSVHLTTKMIVRLRFKDSSAFPSLGDNPSAFPLTSKAMANYESIHSTSKDIEFRRSSTETFLKNTQGYFATVRNELSTRLSFGVSARPTRIVQSDTQAISLRDAISTIPTNLISASPCTTYKLVSPSSGLLPTFGSLLLSSFFPRNDFSAPNTNLLKEISSNTDLSTFLPLPFQSEENYSLYPLVAGLSINSTITFPAIKRSATSLANNTDVRKSSSFFHSQLLTESFEEMTSRNKTLFVSMNAAFTTRPSAHHGGKEGTTFLRANNPTTSVTMHSITSTRFLSTLEMTQSARLSVPVTSSVHYSDGFRAARGNQRQSIRMSLSPASTTNGRLIHTSPVLNNSKEMTVLKTDFLGTVGSTSPYQSLSRFAAASCFTATESNNESYTESFATNLPHSYNRASVPSQGIPVSSKIYLISLSRLETTRSGNVLTSSHSSVSSQQYNFTVVPFKIMDGSLIIRNKNYHQNLSNPNSTMFKALAGTVEAILMTILSTNNTDILDVEVTSFENGSVVAYFKLRVKYDSLLSDQELAQLLNEANETMWDSFIVSNITVILRDTQETSSRPLLGDDNTGHSNTAIIVATLTALGVLFIALASCGCYIYKTKRLCNKSKVEPSDSTTLGSELDNIEPVRRHTWVTDHQQDIPAADLSSGKSSSSETLSLKVLQRKDAEHGKSRTLEFGAKSKRSPFEPNTASSATLRGSTPENAGLTRSIRNTIQADRAPSSRKTSMDIMSSSSTSFET
ncbi:serine-rich adhesin for platelets-like [Montipora capricornis]|uniref:serine-rich adhesin for platelets-like n=1 Tax=Montipora capricornis TaxID=246305 RepID=UPI0035F151CB